MRQQIITPSSWPIRYRDADYDRIAPQRHPFSTPLIKREALTPVQSTGKQFADNVAGSTGLTLTLNGVTAGNLLIITASVVESSGTAIPAPTNYTAAENPAGTQFVGDPGFCLVGIFFRENVGSGTHAPQLTCAGTGNYFTGCLSEWAITGTGNLDVHTNNGAITGTSGNTGTTGTTTQASELVIAVINCDNATSTVTALSTPASSGYTSLASEPTDSTHAAAEHSYKTLAATGTQTASWTWTALAAYNAAIATFKIPSTDTLFAQSVF